MKGLMYVGLLATKAYLRGRKLRAPIMSSSPTNIKACLDVLRRTDPRDTEKVSDWCLDLKMYVL